MPLCECGTCGLEVKPGKRFILGHSSRVNNPMKGKSGELNPRYGMRGALCPAYIDGRYHRELDWKTAVYERDGYLCQNCFGEKKSKRLHAHHIKPRDKFPELKYEISNGITWCNSCHVVYHQIGAFHTEETKKVMSIKRRANIGNPNYLGHQPTLGKHWKLSQETIKRREQLKKNTLLTKIGGGV